MKNKWWFIIKIEQIITFTAISVDLQVNKARLQTCKNNSQRNWTQKTIRNYLNQHHGTKKTFYNTSCRCSWTQISFWNHTNTYGGAISKSCNKIKRYAGTIIARWGLYILSVWTWIPARERYILSTCKTILTRESRFLFLR